MAERRMFAKTIIDSDAFLDMPSSTQMLYFHLSMRADDDGFVNNPKRIMRMIGVANDDLKVLVGKKFILTFDSGVIVIKHWKLHNYIQKDRYKETVYQEEKQQIVEKENKSYSLETKCIQDGYTGKVRLGKVSIGKSKDSLEKDNMSSKYKSIIDYLNEKTGKHYKHTTRKTQELIKARINEGFTEEDFFKVIDIKTIKWGKESKMRQYLRPETLFGTKFESYLNEEITMVDEGILTEKQAKDIEVMNNWLKKHGEL